MFARGGAREGPGVGLEMAFLATYLDVVGRRPLVVRLNWLRERIVHADVDAGGDRHDPPAAAGVIAAVAREVRRRLVLIGLSFW